MSGVDLTPNELALLTEIDEHEFAYARAGEGIPVCELSTFTGSALGGVLSSLVKKGIVTWDGDARRGDVYLTPKGIGLVS